MSSLGCTVQQRVVVCVRLRVPINSWNARDVHVFSPIRTSRQRDWGRGLASCPGRLGHRMTRATRDATVRRRDGTHGVTGRVTAKRVDRRDACRRDAAITARCHATPSAGKIVSPFCHPLPVFRRRAGEASGTWFGFLGGCRPRRALGLSWPEHRDSAQAHIDPWATTGWGSKAGAACTACTASCLVLAV